MQKPKHKNSNIKIYIIKTALLISVLILIGINSNENKPKQDFSFINTSYLYEGDQLVGVTTGEYANKLNETQLNIKNELLEEDDENKTLNTSVINTPSLIKYDLSEKEQNEVITYTKEKTNLLENGYTLVIDGVNKYYINDRDAIKWTIEKILLTYLPDSTYLDYYKTTGNFKPYTIGKRTYTGINIENDVKIYEGYTSGSKYIETKEDLLYNLSHDEEVKEYDIISDTSNIKTIKDENKMTDVEFEINNPTLTENSVTYDGQKILVNPIEPKLNISQTFETTEKEEVEFEIIQEKDEDMLQGQFEVITEGEVGEKEIVYENKMINGEVVETTKISEEVTKKPVHKVVRIGSGSLTNSITVDSGASEYTPSPNSSAGFIWPSSSTRVTCEYGCYSGHTGMDIQSYRGGPIYAAKDGLVVTSGWSNYGYGYHVVIDHGNGIKTLYAHQGQQPVVSVGDYVSQGQVIGFEGSTGRAWGEHLHFEVQINGTAVNPRGYI